MRIFHVVGLGMAIIILKLLTSKVFGEFEDTLLVFFQVIQDGLEHADGAFHQDEYTGPP